MTTQEEMTTYKKNTINYMELYNQEKLKFEMMLMLNG
jgi:hypothetical protein